MCQVSHFRSYGGPFVRLFGLQQNPYPITAKYSLYLGHYSKTAKIYFGNIKALVWRAVAGLPVFSRQRPRC